MRILLGLLVVLAVFVAGCGGSTRSTPPPIQRTATVAAQQLAASPDATSLSATPAPVALVPGMQDVGQFIVSRSGPVRAENRAATTLLHLEVGDEIRFPPGMVWETRPNVGVSGPHWIAASVHVSGHKLYLTGDASGTIAGLASFERIDDRVFSVSASGMALFWANEDGVFGKNGTLADHPVAVDAAGHLWLDAAPVSPGSVVHYGTGVGLEARGMQVIGKLPSVRDAKSGAFFFTVCDPPTCGFTYRVAQLVAPFAGTIECQGLTEFDLVTPNFRLQFRDTDLVRRSWPPGLPSPTPVRCGASRVVRAGELISDGFTHYVVHAVSGSGEPLSVVVANDGTLYVGPLTVPPLDGPGRAK